MRIDQIRRRMWLSASGIFFLSILVTIADRTGILNPFRPALHDALSPGRLMVLAMTSQNSLTVKNEESEDAASNEVQRRNETLLRQFMIENARLRRDLKREQATSAIMQSIEPLNSLAQFELLPASVISSGGMPNSLRDLIVDAGKAAGVTRSELVIAGDGILLDVGSDSSVAAGDRVLTGAIVVGRVDKAARWVSLVQPVTAVGFKSQVILLRQTPDGPHFGAEGMLEGTGNAECTLTGIPHTDAVAVGDEVVSADVNGLRGPRLYFGRVTHAEFLAGGQWDVKVLPAAKIEDLETVGILRLNLHQPATASHKPGERTRAEKKQGDQ